MTKEELKLIKVVMTIKRQHPDAKWMAMDSDGDVWSFSIKPFLGEPTWKLSGDDIWRMPYQYNRPSSKFHLDVKLPFVENYRESLIEI